MARLLLVFLCLSLTFVCIADAIQFADEQFTKDGKPSKRLLVSWLLFVLLLLLGFIWFTFLFLFLDVSFIGSFLNASSMSIIKCMTMIMVSFWSINPSRFNCKCVFSNDRNAKALQDIPAKPEED